eukprot:CAMPEP_0181390654 /NCGR_PEP_ID=MMETSP1106-20121128/25606_1 /TAXON_ID=81844 /ORGANISM="Mantoniella antarctica, Strain SL-175" /LENGTH=103 /DNA_ID=CAMNT_0023511591 /DNA_START=138 /DNA_END=446 /DNA_ORIENTATION=+
MSTIRVKRKHVLDSDSDEDDGPAVQIAAAPAATVLAPPATDGKEQQRRDPAVPAAAQNGGGEGDRQTGAADGHSQPKKRLLSAADKARAEEEARVARELDAEE